MRAAVVDTNVPVVANARQTDASPACVIACTDALEEIVQSETLLVLDDNWEIIQEYLRNLHSSGEPGPGDAFLAWVLENWSNPERCECVPINALEEDGRGYEEFPEDEELADFDPADRKFVAVALASTRGPEILNAVDSDWWIARNALRRNGVEIKFVCDDKVREWRSTFRPRRFSTGDDP